jgi:hypothetical protein
MKRPLFWIVAAVTGFFAWQWWMSRRSPQVNQYIEATNASRQANAAAATAQLDVFQQFAAPLALFRSVVGQVMPDPTQPSHRADGSVVRPLDRTLSDISEPFAGLLFPRKP